MTEKQKCLYPGCLNNSSRYRCSATTHFEFRPTADTDAKSESDTDSDSSLWGDSDSEWHEVPEGAFMSDAMAALYRLKKNDTKSGCETHPHPLTPTPTNPHETPTQNLAGLPGGDSRSDSRPKNHIDTHTTPDISSESPDPLTPQRNIRKNTQKN